MSYQTAGSNRLTIGMACHDDMDGVYFTLTTFKANLTPAQREYVDFVVVDNNPTSAHGELTALVCCDLGHTVKYVPYTDKISTSVRDQVFQHGKGDWVLCVDCHVVVPHSAINAILAFISNPELAESQDLYHGPMVSDCASSVSTHLDLIWRDKFYGTWQWDRTMMGEVPTGTHDNGHPKFDGPPVIEPGPEVPPIEIPSHGMAFFLCRRNAWIKFCPEFQEFGGEEGYIHKKFRKYGSKCWLVPQFLWYHRYHRLHRGYPASDVARIKNFMRGALDLGEDAEHVMQGFSMYHRKDLEQCLSEVRTEIAARKPLISVITKFHFRTECLPEALESFLRQTLTQSEMVIVNNNPKTRVVFDHPRVKIVNMESEPESIYQVVEIGLRAASADWVTFLDDDDVLMPNYLAAYLPFLSGPYDRVAPNRHGQASMAEFHQIANGGCSNIHAVRREFLLAGAITDPTKRRGDWVSFDQDMVADARSIALTPRDDQVLIYRWGKVRRHMSAQTRDWLKMRSEMNIIDVPSEYTPVPRWSVDWQAQVEQGGTPLG